MSSSAQEAAAFLSFIGMILLSMVLASNASIDDRWPGGTSQATHAGVSCQVDAQSEGSALPKSETRNTVQ